MFLELAFLVLFVLSSLEYVHVGWGWESRVQVWCVSQSRICVIGVWVWRFICFLDIAAPALLFIPFFSFSCYKIQINIVRKTKHKKWKRKRKTPTPKLGSLPWVSAYISSDLRHQGQHHVRCKSLLNQLVLTGGIALNRSHSIAEFLGRPGLLFQRQVAPRHSPTHVSYFAE